MNLPPSSSPIAAFFDLDGTLIPFPSLEHRFVRALLYRHAIPVSNFALWLVEMAHLAPRGLAYARQANKMHFRGISPQHAAAVARQLTDASHLQFFPQAIERILWHSSQGHRVVLVSGTPHLLAQCAASSVETVLVRHRLAVTILIRATSLQEASARWTGRVLGDPMFGPVKAAAIDALAARLDLDLSRCYAYGDSIHDRHMLERVGYPVAVNPSKPLYRLASRLGWQTIEWRLPNRSANQLASGHISLEKRKVETLG